MQKKWNKIEAVAVLILMSMAALVHAEEAYSELWDDARLVETPYYILAVPPDWQNFPNMSRGIERNFNIPAIAGIPARYNGNMILASYYVAFEAGAKNNKDKVVEALKAKRLAEGRDQQLKSFKASGAKGDLISTYVAVKLNGRNGQRYDFVVYSKDRGGFYTFSLYVQFAQGQEDFVETYQLDKFAEQVFKHITFKKGGDDEEDDDD